VFNYVDRAEEQEGSIPPGGIHVPVHIRLLHLATCAGGQRSHQHQVIFCLDTQRLQTVGDDRVLALGQVSIMSQGGIPLAQRFANVYDLVDGKLSRVRVYSDWDEALKAVGLEE